MKSPDHTEGIRPVGMTNRSVAKVKKDLPKAAFVEQLEK